jgi:hypothetical protein
MGVRSITVVGLQRAGASVDHASQVVLESLADLLGVVQRLGLARRYQRGGQQRPAVQGQQFLQGGVLGHAQADGLALTGG